MGRPERPVDPTAGPVERLAHGLRELRDAAGRPTYRAMAERAHYSAASLAQAAAGKRLPSFEVLQGYVRACDGDLAEWEARWKEAEAEVAGAPRADADAPPPYRGLARFEPDDRAVFFGRGRLLDSLHTLVCEQRFAVLFGASGSGKSSLLRAGLVPRLRDYIAYRQRPAVLRVLTPGARPAETYGKLLAPREGEPDSWVVVDQFEEVFTRCRDKAERSRFIDMLLAARDPDSRLRVLIVVRADFYVRCAEHPELAAALGGAGLLVGAMSADELRDVVVKPAQAAGLTVERELTARIVEEVLDEPGGLPMLSHALLETWRRRRGRMLSLAAYEAAGGVRGAIAASAETVYGKLADVQKSAARQLLLRMVEPGQGAPDTRRPLSHAELEEWPCAHVAAVVEALTRARLLTGDEDGLHLAHESLITSWPRLHAWIDEDRGRLRHHRMITEAARLWLEHDKDVSVLYRGTRLARAEELFPRYADDPGLTLTERSFMAASVKAREAEAQDAARMTRRARVLATTLSVVMAVALVAGLAAWQQHRMNVSRGTDDAARRLADVADGLRTTDPRTAQLLGVAAWRLSPLPETRRALLGSLAQPETDTFTDPAPGDEPARFLTDSGRTMVSVSGRTWRSWDVASHRERGTGTFPDGIVVSLSPDGRLLVVQRPDGTTRLWDTAARSWTGTPTSTATSVQRAGAGGVFLDSSVDDGTVRVRSVADGKVRFTAASAPGVNSVLSQDGALLAVCPAGKDPQLYDTATGRTLPGAWEKASGICDGSRSELALGGGRFAALSAAGLRVWDTASGKQLAALTTAPGTDDAALSADGAFIAATDPDEVKVWRLSDPAAPVFRQPLNNQYLYDRITWDSARPLLRYLEGGTVHTLDLSAAATPAWTAGPLAGVALSPDGRTLATAERTATGYRVQLRDTRDGKVTRTLPPPRLPAAATPVAVGDTQPLLAFSPDGSALAYAVSAPGQGDVTQYVTLWDTARQRARTTLDLTDSAGSAMDLALGAGGRTLYAVRSPALGTLSTESWDTTSGRRTGTVTAADGAHVTLRPDGRLLLSDDRAVSLPSGKLTNPDLVQGSGTDVLAFTPDGSRLAASDHSGRVHLWDGAARQQAGVLRNLFPAPFGGETELVTALAFSPDGTTLAVGGDAGTLQLWDTSTQQPLGGPLPTSGDAIRSLAFGPDDTTLYASGDHVPLQRYDLDPERVAARVCARTGGTGLSRAQWRLYVPGVAYRKIC